MNLLQKILRLRNTWKSREGETAVAKISPSSLKLLEFKCPLWFKVILASVCYENFLLAGLQDGLGDPWQVCQRFLWSAARAVEASNKPCSKHIAEQLSRGVINIHFFICSSGSILIPSPAARVGCDGQTLGTDSRKADVLGAGFLWIWHGAWKTPDLC